MDPELADLSDCCRFKTPRRRHTYSPWFYDDDHAESIWVVKSETAGATGGAFEGRPRHSRILVVPSGGRIAARIFMRPPQRSTLKNVHLAAKPTSRKTQSCARMPSIVALRADERREQRPVRFIRKRRAVIPRTNQVDYGHIE